MGKKIKDNLGVERANPKGDRRFVSVGFDPDEFEAFDKYIEARRQKIRGPYKLTKHGFVKALVLEAVGFGKGEG